MDVGLSNWVDLSSIIIWIDVVVGKSWDWGWGSCNSDCWGWGSSNCGDWAMSIVQAMGGIARIAKVATVSSQAIAITIGKDLGLARGSSNKGWKSSNKSLHFG